MPFNKGDFTQQGVAGDVTALVRLNNKRIVKMVLSSDDESSNVDVAGTVYDDLNGETYPLVVPPTPTGEPILIETVEVGAVNTTSTTATTVTSSTLSLDYEPYSLLVVLTKGTKDTAGYYHGTLNIIAIEGKSDVTVPDGAGLSTRALMYYYNSAGVLVSKTATTSAGVYVSSFAYSGSDTNITWASKYDSTKGTIDDTFTAYIYGVKLSDLI